MLFRSQQRLEDLGLILDDTRASELDIEAKLAELEGRVAVFRADDVTGKYSDLLALREEEIRLRHAAEELGDIDLTAERNRVARLNQNIADTQKRRSDVLDSIKEKKKTLAAMRQEVIELSAECARLTKEEREATAERDRAQKEFERLEDAVSRKKKEIEELKERQVQTKKQLTEAERLFAELSELSHAPSSVEAELLLDSIRALARELPAEDRKSTRLNSSHP